MNLMLAKILVNVTCIVCCPGEAVQAAQEAPASPIDAAGSASAVLLRDIHCALLRAIEEKGLERDKPQPGQARLLSPDSAGPVPWTANVARVLLSAPVTKASVPAKVEHASSACHACLCTRQADIRKWFVSRCLQHVFMPSAILQAHLKNCWALLHRCGNIQEV